MKSNNWLLDNIICTDIIFFNILIIILDSKMKICNFKICFYNLVVLWNLELNSELSWTYFHKILYENFTYIVDKRGH